MAHVSEIYDVSEIYVEFKKGGQRRFKNVTRVHESAHKLRFNYETTVEIGNPLNPRSRRETRSACIMLKHINLYYHTTAATAWEDAQ